MSPSLGVEMYSISGERDVINHAQHVFEIQKSQLARVVSHQTADHFIPPCHVAIHEICNYGFCGIVHNTTSLGLYFSFSSFKRHTNRGSHLLSGVTGALETSLVPGIITSVSR